MSAMNEARVNVAFVVNLRAGECAKILSRFVFCIAVARATWMCDPEMGGSASHAKVRYANNVVMIAEPVDQLTPRERECLKLVLEPLDNKEIAAAMGIAPNTVANHIKAAKAKLGASTKRQAARIMRDADSRKSASFPSVISTVSSDRPYAAMSDTVSDERQHLREEQMPFDVGTAFHLHRTDATVEETKHDRSIGYRLLLSLTLAIGMAVAFGGLLSGLDAMSRLFRS